VVQVQPFLDGTVKASNLDPGAYRVTVRHPNLSAPVYDNRIRVLGDRPTFVPITIPTDIFSNVPIRQTTAADLGPVRDHLATAADDADRQARKQGGQPIYADDWNAMAGIIGDVARTTSDLTQRVAPLGHQHPELVDKIQEIQDNLNRFFDVFGKTVVQLQRQIQALALQRRVDDAIDNIPSGAGGVDPNKLQQARAAMQQAIGGLQGASDDTPYAYTSQLKRVGEQIAQTMTDVVPDQPAVKNNSAVAAATRAGFALSSGLPAHTFDAELALHQKVDRESGTSSATLALGKR
jgi:hypothetical protein